MSGAFPFNPFAQESGRVRLGVDLREGTIPAGTRAVVVPNPEPDPDVDRDPAISDETPDGDPGEPPTSGKTAPDPQLAAKVLTRGGKPAAARTGPKTNTK